MNNVMKNVTNNRLKNTVMFLNIYVLILRFMFYPTSPILNIHLRRLILHFMVCLTPSPDQHAKNIKFCF